MERRKVSERHAEEGNSGFRCERLPANWHFAIF